eukprot:CAMPEP_0113915556 /NCGR_PEP_ID=MMETSP0780_2-20120614/31337_1 /TAXON_ID=652834 /ORGANISM="Palpitomonas bilix" /LENGTH=118 /DNA_ID=CAMNT_0000914217 /DNA_START=54 /DNA_END=410 /DNA_ORIENTATION=+ /assembly_acc=CAM_ASM_000599
MKRAIVFASTVVSTSCVAFSSSRTPFATKPSGLEVRDEKLGVGKEAHSRDTVAVHYTGYFKDGRVFDSSRARDSPLLFTLGKGNVISGWEEGVQGMKEGGQRRLVVPSELEQNLATET